MARTKRRAILAAGFVCLAAAGGILETPHPETPFYDIALKLLLGVGIGLLLVGQLMRRSCSN
jgi:hydrogenase/urease accessory protein HupE